jgi:hypothetical protein
LQWREAAIEKKLEVAKLTIIERYRGQRRAAFTQRGGFVLRKQRFDE